MIYQHFRLEPLGMLNHIMKFIYQYMNIFHTVFFFVFGIMHMDNIYLIFHHFKGWKPFVNLSFIIAYCMTIANIIQFCLGICNLLTPIEILPTNSLRFFRIAAPSCLVQNHKQLPTQLFLLTM